MGTIIAKAGAKIETRKGISDEVIQRKMQEVLELHPHICGTCDGKNCNHKVNIRHEFVIRGVEVSIGKERRSYIFDCLCFKKAKLADSLRIYTPAEIEMKYGSLYSCPVLCGNSEINLDELIGYDMEDTLEERELVEEQYAELLADFDEPFIFNKKKSH